MSGTTERYALGLVVGKFAPLHLGHEWLVQQAAKQCERLIILSYSNPEFARCGVIHRRQWLASRFPEHECLVIDDTSLASACRQQGLDIRPMPLNSDDDLAQQAWLAWLLHGVLKKAPNAMFCSEDYGPSCAETLSRVLGQKVIAVVVDRERVNVPINATAIRSTPTLARRWTAPEVAGAFVRRVVLLGGESSGKTSLAAALALRLDTTWVAEYGRELWERQGGLDEADLLKVARQQVVLEESAARSANTWLFCDTSPLTTLGYSHWTFGRADPALVTLATREYDAIILCQPDFPFVQDGTRRDDEFRHTQHAWYLAGLQARNVPWLAVAGSIAQRADAVVAWLKHQTSSSALKIAREPSNSQS